LIDENIQKSNVDFSFDFHQKFKIKISL